MPRPPPARAQRSSDNLLPISRRPQQSALLFSPSKRLEDDTNSSEESEDSDESDDEGKGNGSDDDGRDIGDVRDARSQQSNTALLIIIGVLLILVGAGASYLYWEHAKGSSASDSSAEGSTTARTTVAQSSPTSSKSAPTSAPSGSSKTDSASRSASHSGGGADDSSRTVTKDTSATKEPAATGSTSKSSSGGGAETGASTTTTASSSSSTLSTFAKQAVDAHNAVRSTHHAPDVSWDDSLAAYADNWAHGCVFEHSGGPHGENLFAVFPAQDQLTDPTDGIKSWASEESMYDYNNPGFSMNTGHFTQLVWVGSTKIGCSLVACDSAGMSILVCNYEEFGNMGGEFETNVLPP